MRKKRSGLWALAAASFALMAWLILPFPERPRPEQSAPALSEAEAEQPASLAVPARTPIAG